MENCLKCKRFRIYPKDLALLRLSQDESLLIKHKCVDGTPQIRRETILRITKGHCSAYDPINEE